ncbi:MAG: head morphogenesis protein [Myxococcales bacterium]|nr:head morphogenesis protein [Myxococcales bacterium]
MSLLEVHDARVFADELLEQVLRPPIAKAMDLGSPQGFDRASTLLAARLRRSAAPAEVDALREAVAVLDVDWGRTTAAQRRRLVAESLVAAGRSTALIPQRIQSRLGDAATAVINATRTHSRQVQELAIGAKFNALDHRVARHIVNAQGLFARDEYGRRLDVFGREARRVVASGLARGLGRVDIGGELEAAARVALIDRAPFYWEVVASAFVGQGRSFAQVSSYAEAGVQRYRIEAVLDERTTHICRFLHGKTFSVADALRKFEQVDRLEQPEAIKRLLPWVRERRDGDRLTLHGGGVRIADVTRSALGNRDDVGEFRSHLSDERLVDAGLGLPPFHALCRSASVSAQ